MEPCVVVFVSVSVSVVVLLLVAEWNSTSLSRRLIFLAEEVISQPQIAEGAGVVCVAVFSIGVVEVLLDAILTVKHFIGAIIGSLFRPCASGRGP